MIMHEGAKGVEIRHSINEAFSFRDLPYVLF